jgi:D-alanyl-D-alanine carboxypeptidase/D-alanyl-D-alanine-endopeptidase (penicillin-binding protein 4)
VTRRRGGWRRWGPPLVLLLGALGCGAGALAVEAKAGASPPDGDVVPIGTPVLSVRRMPSVVAAPVAARRLRADLEAWAATAPVESCAVVADGSGDVVLDLRGEMPVVPASTQKLLIATAALVRLGDDFRFHTAAVAAPPVDGTISGDLTLVGGGDPLLATRDYAARYERQPQIYTDLTVLAQRIVDAGVRRITGSVVGDEARYDRVRYVPGWPQRYLDQDVTGPLSALAVNDSYAAYPAAPDDPGQVEPAADPAVHAADVLTALLEDLGVEVAGPPGAGTAPPGAAEVAGLDSPPLTEVLAELLRESDNATAELLLKELGRVGGDPSTAGGRAVTAEVLTGAGLDLTRTAIADGSGLAVENRLTCGLLVTLLDRPQTGDVLRDSLAVAGETGTLSERFVGTPLEGHLHAKTGSLTAVAALAGRVIDEDGSFTFAYVVNAGAGRRVDEDAAVASQQQLGEILLGWPRVAGVAVLGPQPPPQH